MSACSLKLHWPAEAVAECDRILGELDPSNAKAIFRKGSALTLLEKFDEAREELRRGLKLENLLEADAKKFKAEINKINKSVEKMENQRYEESHRGISEESMGVSFLQKGSLLG